MYRPPNVLDAMQGLTAFQYDLLAAINAVGTAKGLRVKAELEDTHEKYGGEVNHGRLYPNLDKLVQGGLVDKSTRDKRTNDYTLTDAGHAALRERVQELAGGTPA